MTVNIGFFTVLETFGNLIQDNVQDIKIDRTNKRWVFPEFPEKNTNLPQVVLKLAPFNYESNSNSNIIFTETIGEIYNEYYYRKATSQIQIYVLTEKRTSYKVTRENTEFHLYGEKLNSYLTNEIKEMIWKQHEFGILPELFDKAEVTNIEFNYDDTKTVWGSTILCDIVFKDYFVKKYNSGELIASYSLNETITY